MQGLEGVISMKSFQIKIQSFYGPVIEKLYFATLHHFLSISLDKQWSITGHTLLLCKNCTIIVCTKLACCTRIVYTKLSDSLLSQCSINWIYHLYSENILLV